MGRTSFKVATHLIRDLREKLRLTQAEVAEKIGVHLTRYQNIEWKGTTSPKTAAKLAELFAISVDALQQGLEAPDPWVYLQQIEQTIRDVLAKGENPLLQQALQQTFAETRFTSGSDEENREDAIHYLAEDIAQRIEAVQLLRNKNEIAELSALIGLTEEELLRPANAEGIWFVNIHRREHQFDGFNAHSEVTQRAGWAIGILKEYVEKYIQNPCSDKSIDLTQDGFWYRIHIYDPSRRRTIRIDLVRCLPEAKGLRWVKPVPGRDEDFIRNPLHYWARENFNFVCNFDGKQSPSGDIRQLRFLVTEYNQSIPGVSCPTGRMVISGNLKEIRDETIAYRRQEGGTHSLVQNCLTNDLKCALANHLTDYPPECWSMSGLHIQLDENKSKDRKRPLLERFWGTKYSIELVEQVGEQFEPVPWREKDKQSLQESIQKMLDAPNDPAWATDEPRRSFAPYSAEP